MCTTSIIGNIVKNIGKDHIVIDENLIRPAEVDTLLADCSKAKKILNWQAKVSFDELVTSMVDADLENIDKHRY